MIAAIPRKMEHKIKKKYFVPPAFVAFFGFLVYFLLFESFARERELMKGLLQISNMAWLQSLYSVWKIVVFSLTIWVVNSKRYFFKKDNLILGSLITFIGAALLLFFSYNYTLNTTISIFVVDGISAIGEGLLSAGIVTYIRGYSSNDDDYSYSSLTTFLRIGQNCGMVASLIVSNDLWRTFPKKYALFLMVFPIIILMVSIYFKKIVKRVPVIVYEIENVKLKMNIGLWMDIIVGACASGLFYLIVLGPIVLFKEYNINKAFQINGYFSVAALVIILIIFNRIKSKKGFNLSFDKMVLFAKKAMIFNVLFWMLFIILFFFQPATAFLIYFTGGVLGLFSTSSYVFGELNSGIKGKKELRTKHVLSYLGLARIGPAISLIIIAMCRFFIDKQLMERWFALLLLELIVFVGITGIFYTIKVKQKQSKQQLA